MRRRWLAAMVLAMTTACGPTYKDAAEERAHLESLSNPTAAQFRRREELRARAEKEKADEMRRLNEEAGERTIKIARDLEAKGDVDGAIAQCEISLLDLSRYQDSEVRLKLQAERDRLKASKK